jgi:hypothetical protein
MDIILDADLMDVVKFMQSRLSANRLVPIANAVAKIAPVLWGHFTEEELIPARLAQPEITVCAEQILSTANE